MSDKVYPAEKVDTLLKAASEAMHGIKDYAAQLEEENKQLKERITAKQASSEKVVLEKVASISKEKVEDFVAMLEDRTIIPVGSREKYAAAMEKSPDAILDISMHALKLSESPVSQGRGIKSASANKGGKAQELQEEEELWSQAANSGRWD